MNGTIHPFTFDYLSGLWCIYFFHYKKIQAIITRWKDRMLYIDKITMRKRCQTVTEAIGKIFAMDQTRDFQRISKMLFK